MGTLGCINDMLQRDKENRELRKLNKERMKEHHKYLVNNCLLYTSDAADE